MVSSISLASTLFPRFSIKEDAHIPSNYKSVLDKLKSLFEIETLMLGGGVILNKSFIHVGMCDEINVVIAPCADGSTKTTALFSKKDCQTIIQ